jgi:hypothetical protein
MDRRLSGALAWGALIIILGLPGAEMLGRQTQPVTDSVGAVGSTPNRDAVTLSWQAAGSVRDAEQLGPPAPPPQPQAVVDDAPPLVKGDDVKAGVVAVPNPVSVAAQATAQHSFVAADELEIAINDAATVIAGIVPPELRDVDIAAPKRAPQALPDRVIPMAAPETEYAAVSEPTQVVTPGTVLAATDLKPAFDRTVTPALPELIPYPAPASQRPRKPVVVAVSRPVEPVPHIRPDNAIFFHDWKLVPPLSIGTGPGR